MIAAQDLVAIPFLSLVPPDDLARLAQASGDVRLAAGDYAIHEDDERGHIRTGGAVARSGQWPLDRDPYLLETSVPGIFASGDVRSSPVKRVAAAVGEGSMAIAFVHQFLAQSATTTAAR